MGPVLPARGTRESEPERTRQRQDETQFQRCLSRLQFHEETPAPGFQVGERLPYGHQFLSGCRSVLLRAGGLIAERLELATGFFERCFRRRPRRSLPFRRRPRRFRRRPCCFRRRPLRFRRRPRRFRRPPGRVGTRQFVLCLDKRQLGIRRHSARLRQNPPQIVRFAVVDAEVIENVHGKGKRCQEQLAFGANPEVVDAVEVCEGISGLTQPLLPGRHSPPVGVGLGALDDQHLRPEALPVATRDDGVLGAFCIDLQEMDVPVAGVPLEELRQRQRRYPSEDADSGLLGHDLGDFRRERRSSGILRVLPEVCLTFGVGYGDGEIDVARPAFAQCINADTGFQVDSAPARVIENFRDGGNHRMICADVDIEAVGQLPEAADEQDVFEILGVADHSGPGKAETAERRRP